MEELRKIQHVTRRGDTYTLRLRIPSDLVGQYDGKKEITKSLKTTDYHEAKRRSLVELALLEAEFLEKRQNADTGFSFNRSISDLNEIQMVSIAIRWLRKSEASDIAAPMPEDLDEAISNIGDDLSITEREYREGLFQPEELKGILRDEKINYDDEGPNLNQFADLIFRAKREAAVRAIQRLNGMPITGTGDLDFSVPAQADQLRPITTFGMLCDLYVEERKDGLKARTLKGKKEDIGLLKRFIRPEKNISEISRQDCRSFASQIRKYPANASKIYPGFSVETVISKAAADNRDPMSTKRQNNYIELLSSILQFGVDELLIDSNPARKLQKPDTVDSRKKIRPYTIDQLNSIFSAPLYTGCINDDRGYNKPGDAKPRGPRFWIPVIALFSGLRMEEICTLHENDIEDHSGTFAFRIHRSTKTKNSARVVPVHPELIKLGFLDYVSKIRKDGKSHLFAELNKGAQENYSHVFSKWYARFVTNIGVKSDRKINFHSFRHTFRFALQSTKVPMHLINEVCGWEQDGTGNTHYGDDTPVHILMECVEAVRYPGLDIQHLRQT